MIVAITYERATKTTEELPQQAQPSEPFGMSKKGREQHTLGLLVQILH